MFQDTFSESTMPNPADGSGFREEISVSFSPMGRQQWEALQRIAAERGETRADLLRSAIERLLNDRDAGKPVIYRAKVRLSAAEKMMTKPRTVWLMPEALERIRERCEADRVEQSEFIVEAIRRHLNAEKITIDPPL